MDKTSNNSLMQITMQERQKSCDVPRKLANDVPPQALCVIELYGDSGTFLSRMNPSTQIIAAENPEKAYKSEISLTKVKLAFGMPFLKVWLMAQLENLNDFCGTKSKMTIDQMDELTGIIAVDYGYLRAAEILLFFHRLKKGQYGQFYGSVDPLMIASALFQHVKDRQIEISRIEAAENQKRLDNQRKEWKNNAISREEYENIKQSQVSLN